MASKTTPLSSENWPEFPSEGLRDNLTLNDATIEEQLDADWSTLGAQPVDTSIPRRLPPEELKKFVLDYMAGAIFTSAHVKDDSLLPVIFMPLALGALANVTEESLKDIGCLWAYMSESVGTRSINGYPFFGSVRFMHKDDWARASAAILRERSRQDDIEV